MRFQEIKKEESGRSMVEMLGVLAIIGVLSVGGISGYSKAMAKYKASKAMDQLSLLIANIRTAFSTVSNYSDLNNRNAARYSIVSRDMYVAGTSLSGEGSFSLLNAFGGALILKSEDYNGVADAGFSIAYTGLNQEACIQLATADWGTGGLHKIDVGSKAISVSSMPIKLSAAYGYCSADTTTITWYFY